MKKSTKKLSINKVTVAKLNNAAAIKGGGGYTFEYELTRSNNGCCHEN